MKKLYFAIILWVSHTLCALPVGNPSEASLFYPSQMACCEDNALYCNFVSFGIGFYGDYVFNRYMRTVQHKDIDWTRLFTNSGYLVVNVLERADLFAALGVSRLSLNTSFGAFNAADPHPLFEVESDTAFSYGIGGRITLLECHCFSLGLMGEYFATEPDIKRMYIASGAVVYPDDNLRTRYSEWQIAGGISYRYNDFFVPYAALKYAQSYWKFGNGETFVIEDNTAMLFNMKNRKNWGYAIGLTLSPLICEKMAVTVEGRFAAEAALYVNAQARW